MCLVGGSIVYLCDCELILELVRRYENQLFGVLCVSLGRAVWID
jgi:hypothetical protein